MRSVPLPFLSKITLLWTRAREPGPVSPVKVDSPLPFPWTQRGEIYSCSPLLETQSQRSSAPLDTSYVRAEAIYPIWGFRIFSART